jgi:hypothetical protein
MTLSYILGEADRVFRESRRALVAGFAQRLEVLGARVARLDRGTRVIWACAGHLGCATIRAFSQPAVDDPGRPLVLRASIGAPPAGLRSAVSRLVGPDLELADEPGGQLPMPAAAFTFLPGEATALAPWLAEWALCRVTSRRRLPPPPVEFRGNGTSLRHLRAARDAWTAQAHEAHWRWHGPVLVKEVQARKCRLGLAFEPGFELGLLECQTPAERQFLLGVYGDWLEENGHIFEAACAHTGSDPADVLVGEGVAWGLRRGRFAAHPDFRRKQLRFPLLGRGVGPVPGRCYGSASEARADFLSAW